MPSLDWNKSVWDRHYDWAREGDEWSASWGGAGAQWYWTILPRIHPYVPVGTILELGPGFGRWTQWLKDLCHQLILVDLSEKCINACRERFADATHLSYHTNDGTSLDMVPAHSVDFVFSFDSLVHAELEVLRSYLEQLRDKLTPDGVAFLHHSNIGAYERKLALLDRLPGKTLLERWRLLERNPHGRAVSVTAAKFEQLVANAGMQCISQELINWGSRRLIDCFSVFTRSDSRWARPNRLLRNAGFMAEASRTARMAQQYSMPDQQG